MKIKSKIKSCVFIGILASCISSNIINIEASGTVNTAPNSARQFGSGYWQSSTIREWLNSESNYVEYTSLRPDSNGLGKYAYDNQPGFLTNFTENERNAIAITRRRVMLSDETHVKDGGNRDAYAFYRLNAISPQFEGIYNNWDSYNHQVVNDKVFLLNIVEYFYYLECNDLEYTKKMTDFIKEKYNRSSDVADWFLTAQRVSNLENKDFNHSISADGYSIEASPSSALGTVPALHVKPDYVFSNGKRADSLNVGEKVNFGTYNSEPIVWDVVNITNDGYAMLVTEKIIDLKPFDVPGEDVVYRNSRHINFNSYDVDISSDLQRRGRNGDRSIPELNVANEDQLFARQDGYFNMELRATDAEGIKYIELPNGNKVFGDTTTYRITSNGNLHFKVCDNNGNTRSYVFFIGNINMPSQVLISSSNEDWTNQDVQVSIKASSDVGTNIKSVTSDYRDFLLTPWENYNSYAGKRVRISGSVRVTGYDKPLGDISTAPGFMYQTVRKSSSGDYVMDKGYGYGTRYKLSDIVAQGEIFFNDICTIPGNYNSEFMPFLQLDVPFSERGYSVEWNNLKYELIDTDGFGIEKIVLPDNTEIRESSYTATLTEYGEHTFRVYDNNGRVTEKTILAKIDKVNPSIDFKYNTEYTNKDLNVLVTGKDDRSGVTKIISPDGSENSPDSFEYNVLENGTYNFKIHDRAGNIATVPLQINNIDRGVTNISINKTPESFTNSDVTININVNDYSGVKYIVLPSGQKIYNNSISYTVSSNGVYGFYIFDMAGNKEIIHVEVTNIDKKKPIVSISKNPNNEWSNVDVNVEIDATD